MTRIHELFEHPLPGTLVAIPGGYGTMIGPVTNPDSDNRTAIGYHVDFNGTRLFYYPAQVTRVSGMRVDVFRWGLGDCTNGGVTSAANGTKTVIIVGAGIDPIFTANPNDVVLKIVKRNLRGVPYYHAEPLLPPPSGHVGWMAGGNFVYSSDSRFNDATAGYPIAVHDRSETTKEYASNSF